MTGFWGKLSIFWKTFLLSMILLTSMVLIGEEVDDLAFQVLKLFGKAEFDLIDEVIWWLMAIIMCGLFGSWLLSRAIARPLTRLAAYAKKIAKGDLALRLPKTESSRGDEIGDLARAFNQMTETLVGLLENERRLMRDISHDLRSPLSRVRLTLALVREKLTATLAPYSQRYFQLLDQDVARLENMLTSVLERARLESVGFKGLEKRPLNLKNLVLASVRDFLFKAESENKSIEVPSLLDLTILGDEEIIKSALDNLLSNAVYYTAKWTTVTVSLERQVESIVLAVEDRGPGVPEEWLLAIFKPFFRTDEARRSSSGGFGLGLSIVQKAADLHGGRTTAVNVRGERGEILGLKVTISWPVLNVIPT
ncbi:MAG: HAMP domain-containing histidine kinase [Deltaproteobacteria bacterium]|jgi:two-component system sensor histidine kinase CpxA|nr:HAMP domain-containing histidine kinase [Deltaproteobacteria bacterium]